jgi:hypothetical protein
MTWRALAIGLLAAGMLAAAGCGGGNGDGGDAAGGSEACTTAKADLELSVSERDRLFVDQRLKDATMACADEYDEPGSVERCTEARAVLEAAAAAETPPPDLEETVESAVAACVDTKITATIPAP